MHFKPEKDNNRIYDILITAVGILLILYIIGIVGFMFICNLPFVIALHNASLYLTGMGPLYKFTGETEKEVFSSLYTLIARIFFVIILALVVDEFILPETAVQVDD